MISKNMARIMKEKGITGAALAEAAGCSRAAVSQYMNGVNMPSWHRIEAIAEILGVTVEELEGREHIDSRTEDQEIPVIQPTLSITQAARLMHKHVDYVKAGLIQGRPGFEFGSAVKISSRWSFFISAAKFTEVTGIPVPERRNGGK